MRLVDQQNNDLTGALQPNIQGAPAIGQDFKPTQKTLDVVELRTSDGINGNNLGATLQVKIHNGTIGGAVLGTSGNLVLVDSFSGLSHFDFAAPVALTPRNVYALEVLVTAGDGWYVTDTNNNYAGGTEFKNGISDPNSDLWFKEGPAAAPEPSSVVLLFVAVIGFVTLRKRFNRHLV